MSIKKQFGLAVLFSALGAAQAFSPVADFTSTVSTLPSASSYTNKRVLITDGSVACDTTVGSGSTLVLAVSNGSSWIAVNCSGGSANPANLVSISYASSITPTCTSSSKGTLTTFVVGALTGNITINNPSGCTVGQGIRILLLQDGTGGRTLTWGSAYGSTTQQMNQAANAYDGFDLWWDGSLWQFGPKPAFAGSAVTFTTAAPSGSAQTGAVIPWCDSTSNICREKDSSGVIRAQVKELSANSVRCAGGANADDAACTAVNVSTPLYGGSGGGTANAQTATGFSPTPPSTLPAGTILSWIPTATNTSTSVTLTINGGFSCAIFRSSGTVVQVGDIVNGWLATVKFDGSNCQLQNPQATSGGATVALNGTCLTIICLGNQTVAIPSATSSPVYTRFTVPSSTFGHIGVFLGTTTSSSVALAIYNSGCSSLLGTSAAFAAPSSASFVSVPFSQTLAAGSYVMAISTNDTTTGTVYAYQSGGNGAIGGGSATQFVTFTGANAASWSGTTPTFPATCGTLTNASGSTPVYVAFP